LVCLELFELLLKLHLVLDELVNHQTVLFLALQSLLLLPVQTGQHLFNNALVVAGNAACVHELF
jgi:hypothetical protein